MLNSHPNMYELIDYFRREQSSVSNEIVKLHTGIKPKRKTKLVLNDERIYNLVIEYKKTNVLDILNRICLIISY